MIDAQPSKYRCNLKKSYGDYTIGSNFFVVDESLLLHPSEHRLDDGNNRLCLIDNYGQSLVVYGSSSKIVEYFEPLVRKDRKDLKANPEHKDPLVRVEILDQQVRKDLKANKGQ
jgi:hypothetical protein